MQLCFEKYVEMLSDGFVTAHSKVLQVERLFPQDSGRTSVEVLLVAGAAPFT
jgi:hypothetical protein